MSVVLESTRFGTVSVADEAVLEFPRGLIGLGGTRYALLATSADSPFSWLHSLEDPGLALPVTRPSEFFPGFALEVSDPDAEELGVSDAADVEVFVTVRAAERLEDFTANLKAPIVVAAGRAVQVINADPAAAVRAPLIAPADGV